jgi:hypothetical protein
MEWTMYPFGTHIGLTTDAEAAADGSLIAIVKRIRTLLGGTLTVAGAVTTTPSAPALVATTCTIAIGQSESAEVDLGGRALVAIVTPAAVEATTAQVSLKHGVVSGTRHFLQKLGTKMSEKIDTTNLETRVDVADYAALHYVSIVAETAAGAAVVQATAEREFVLLSRAL